jgi:hypothetical protein
VENELATGRVLNLIGPRFRRAEIGRTNTTIDVTESPAKGYRHRHGDWLFRGPTTAFLVDPYRNLGNSNSRPPKGNDYCAATSGGEQHASATAANSPGRF